RWRDAAMMQRWVAASFLATEKNFRRIMGWKDLWQLQALLGTPLGVRCDRSHHDLRKENPREQRKVYWSRCSSSNDLGSGDGFQGQVSHGIHLGNESRNHSGILCRIARNFVGHFRRRNLGCLALRSAQAACGQV